MREEQIFHQVLEQPADQREAFLSAVCGVDLELRERVGVLLRAQANPGSFLQSPAAGVSLTIDQIRESPGTLIGPYKLLEQIGEGGMGVVYVAEQTEPVRRRVALKIIKPGMDTRQVIARFEAERQALAMMEHPNIARVLDAGTVGGVGNRESGVGEGRPYFVMELVRGLPITDYCDKARLSPRQRLALLVDVCYAVQHAHQKGVIHRDLKPSNVMITVHDGRPAPKVIDFGVAKAVGQQLTERTVYTAHTQLVGTPLYMSPEQADLSSQDVDTRSDVYSLGVLLYELLTGQTPFDKETLHKAGFDEMRRIIREDEPPRPSHRVSTLGAQASSTISQQRSLDERRLSQVLRGELDWIVMKALEKDRSRRYESASSLASDIQRYLSDEPVLACPPTIMYRFQKFARKHKPALVTAAAIALCLLLGTTVSAWQAVRATTAQAEANANAVQAQEKAKEATEQRDEVKATNEKLLATQAELRATLYATHMRIAQDAWEGGAIERVQEVLTQTTPKPGETDLRGFEWHYLYRLSHGELFTVERERGQWDYHRQAFSPDGRLLAAYGATYDKAKKGYVHGEFRIWEAQTGKVLSTFKGHRGPIVSVAVSPDGKRVASGFRELKVWDAQTGEELISLKGHTGGINSVAFSPDGKRVATGGQPIRVATGGAPISVTPQPGELKVWDAQTGEELFNLTGHTDGVTSVVFSPDGKRLASSSSPRGNELKIWDALTGRELLTLKGGTPRGGSGGIAFSPDGQRLAGVADGEVKVWNTESGQELFALKGPFPFPSFNIVFSPDDQRLAITSGANIKLWDAQTGQEIGTLPGHTSRIGSIAYSPDSTRLLSAADDGTIKVWDAQPRQRPLVLKGHKGGLIRVAYSPDGKRLASAGGDVKVWDTQTRKELLTLKGHTGPVFGVAFSPDGKHLATSSNDKTLKMWDAQTGQELRTLTRSTDELWSVAFSPDGKLLAGPDDKALKMWDAQTGQELRSLKHNSQVWYVAFSPDSKRLATASADQIVRIWDAHSGQELHALKGHTADLEQVVFSPDGQRLASACDDKTVKVWDAQTGQELLSLKHFGAVWDVAFSPDGKRLASGTAGPESGEVKVWDAQTGQELLTYKGHKYFNGVAFSPDGHWLAGGTEDKSVILWDATPLAEKP